MLPLMWGETGRMQDMKAVLMATVIILTFVGGVWVGYDFGSDVMVDTKECRENWQIELDMSAIESRLATLERIGIRLDVIDHTGLWMVQGVSK